MSHEPRVLAVVRTLLERRKLPAASLSRTSRLYQDGLGLDSLAAAELSVMLEMEFKTDPFTEGDIPRTVGDVIDFYDRRGPQA